MEHYRNLFATQITANMSQFKTLIQSTKKGDLTLNEYLFKVKLIVDQLASISYILSVKDNIEAILEGLSSIYDTFKVFVSSRFE